MSTSYASEAFLHQILGKALSAGASDVHLKVGQPPGARVRGDLVFFRVDKLTPEDTEAAVRILTGLSVGPESVVAHEKVFAYQAPGLGRFRVSAFRQRGALSVVMRSIPLTIPVAADLGLPPAATSLVEQDRGLVLFAGVSGSGKSTSAAALIGHLNQNYPRHVITLEEPIEHLHEDSRGCVAQRAVGIDVPSLSAGLHAALLQDADVIYAADLRAPDALEAALDAAEQGHLVLAGVGAPDVSRAVGRLFAMGRGVPDFASRFAGALQGVLAQRLVPKKDESGLALVCEVLVATAAVREALRGGSSEHGSVAAALQWQMEKGAAPHGMQTFDTHQKQLAAQGLVSRSGGSGGASGGESPAR